MYLLALSSHCPYHWHLEWLRLMWEQVWVICLKTISLKSHVPWIRVPKPHATRLRSQASSYHCKHTCIIENANGVPPARWYGSFPISKWQDKQTMNTSTYLLFTIGYSFSFWDAWCGTVLLMKVTVQLGTPRGRYDEHSSKFFPQ
jgi:hypothetical protein